MLSEGFGFLSADTVAHSSFSSFFFFLAIGHGITQTSLQKLAILTYGRAIFVHFHSKDFMETNSIRQSYIEKNTWPKAMWKALWRVVMISSDEEECMIWLTEVRSRRTGKQEYHTLRQMLINISLLHEAQIFVNYFEQRLCSIPEVYQNTDELPATCQSRAGAVLVPCISTDISEGDKNLPAVKPALVKHCRVGTLIAHPIGETVCLTRKTGLGWKILDLLLRSNW